MMSCKLREKWHVLRKEKIFFICPTPLPPEQVRFKQFPIPGGGGGVGTVTGRIEPYITTRFLSEKELNRPILFKS